ncbi:MAG: hypothetical protein EP314_08040, partial [Bacteroidetes bacterium]
MKKITAMLFMAGVIIGCGDKPAEETGTLDTEVVSNPATADNETGADGDVAVPVFTFEKEVHDFGTIVQG